MLALSCVFRKMADLSESVSHCCAYLIYKRPFSSSTQPKAIHCWSQVPPSITSTIALALAQAHAPLGGHGNDHDRPILYGLEIIDFDLVFLITEVNTKYRPHSSSN